MNPKAALATLGCKVNQYETEKIAGALAADFELVDFKEAADVYVINTCTVTREGDHKSRQLVRRARARGPRAIVVMTGCYAERLLAGNGATSDSESRDVLERTGIDILVGNDDKMAIASLVKERLAEGTMTRPEKAELESAAGGRGTPPRTAAQKWHSRPLVKIQDGCDEACAYCIVPSVRGRPRSRPIGEVVDEVKELVLGGAGEIVLTGVNLGKYDPDGGRSDASLGGDPTSSRSVGGGASPSAGAGLERLLAALFDLDLPRFRVRLSSIEVGDVRPSLAEMMRSGRLCRHLHIPLQSGDAGVLRAMGRPYDPGDYLATVESLKAAVPGIAVTTDVIVGFPGESRQAFLRTLEIARRARFRKIHVFKYSARPGTRAAELGSTVASEEAADRSNRLIELSDDLERGFAARFYGETLEVVIVRQGLGMSDNYLSVRLRSDRERMGEGGGEGGCGRRGPGSLVRVDITGCEGATLLGSAR